MLDLKLLQKNPEIVAESLKKRHSSIDMSEFSELDKKRRAMLGELEALQSERNKASGEVARLKREGQSTDELMGHLSVIAERIKALDKETDVIKEAVQNWVLGVPNIPDASVPLGAGEDDNQVVLTWGEPTKFAFPVKDHVELGTSLGGLTALFAMLSSCAGGVGVVGIDNGFGAAYLACTIINSA